MLSLMDPKNFFFSKGLYNVKKSDRIIENEKKNVFSGN